MSKKAACCRCGNELREDEGYWVEGCKKDVCRECYDDEVVTCQLCGDTDVMPSDVSEFILCNSELSTTADRPPGIYKVLSRPFLMIPLIGGGSLMGSDVLFIDKLPKPDAEYEISGHICKKCSRPYAKTFSNVYRFRPALWKLCSKWKGCKGQAEKWRAVLQLTAEGWAIQRDYTRSVIMANPDMLRDLECDSVARGPDGNSLSYANANDWEKLKKRYDLPDGIPTYHEWVAVRHKGVTVYHTIPGNWCWMSLRPEPRFRAGAGRIFPETFAASGLPGYDSKGTYDYHTTGTYSRPAIIDAIDRGCLRQDGCFDLKGKPCVYG